MDSELWIACCWKMALMALLSAALVEKNEAKPELNSQNPLDMAPNSVDDMYTGCEKEMQELVEKQYLKNELNNDPNFKEAWEKAEKFVIADELEKEQKMAIYVYALGKPKIYPDFNKAVRTQKSEYKTTFRYHSLHFFLTGALQALNSHKSKDERCLTGYRRVDRYFSRDVLNKEFRFGTFTSSLKNGYPDPKIFGNKTCFKIYTCFGADISLLREVLIPPYEVFKVTKIEEWSEQNSLPCEVVYEVKSTEKTVSNLNCTLLK